MNNVCFLGRITKDPEVKLTGNGKPYCRFTLAVDRDKENTDFIPCVSWGDTAENMGKHVQKGQQLLIQGKLQSGSYQDESGITRYTLDAFVYRVEFLQKPRGSQGAADFYPVKDDDFPPFD